MLRIKLPDAYELRKSGLAMEYEVDSKTLSRRLKRAGVQLRRQGLSDEQKAEAERLYVSGQSLKQVAAVFGCDSETVRQTLKKRGVRMRYPWQRG